MSNFEDRDYIKRKIEATEEEQQELWENAKIVKNQLCKEKVYIRGIIEVSNNCKCLCKFCGNAAYVKNQERYRLNFEEIKEQILYAKRLNLDVVHLASGEDPLFDFEILCKAVKYMKEIAIEPELAIGKLTQEQYEKLIQLGAKRFILKFETSDKMLFQKVKKCNANLQDLLDIIDYLIDNGCDVGTGNMIGLPGQTLDSIVDDLLLVTKKRLRMISTSVFMPNSESMYFDRSKGNENWGLNYLALIRCLNPEKNISIPTNSTFGIKGKKDALTFAANEISLNITPLKYRENYSIYSGNKRRKDDYKSTLEIIKEADCSLASLNEVIYGTEKNCCY